MKKWDAFSLHAAERADALLADNREKLDTLSEELISREMLDDSEVESVIGPSVPRRSPATPDDANSITTSNAFRARTGLGIFNNPP